MEFVYAAEVVMSFHKSVLNFSHIWGYAGMLHGALS